MGQGAFDRVPGVKAQIDQGPRFLRQDIILDAAIDNRRRDGRADQGATGIIIHELATQERRKQARIAQDKAFNTLGILGATAAITPVPVNARTLSLDNPVMIGLTLLLFPLMRRRMKLGRGDGIFLLTLLATYSVLLYLLPG